MPVIRGSLTQSGADTLTTATIETGLTSDGKSGWSILGIRILWLNGELAAAADWEMNAALTTTSSSPSFISADEIVRVAWGLQNTAGVAVAVPYEPVKTELVFEERITVQQNLYMQALSTLTGTANTINYQIFYEVVKLSDLEVLRLLAGGA